MSNENKIAHLDMIQGVINRMGNNSFLIKGWVITLVLASFALSIENYKIIFITFIPILLFGWLDVYFLYQEILYRGLYKYVISIDNSDITFSMDVNEYKSQVGSMWKVLFRPTIMYFYLTLMIVVMASYFII